MNFRFLKIAKAPDSKVLEILQRNIIGTPGVSMLYQHLGVADKIHQIAKPFFVNLMRGAALVGTCCFCERTTANAGTAFKAFYIRYFSFRDIFRRKSVTQKTLSRKSALRNEVESLLHGTGLETTPNEKFFHYAYVDPRNVRSASLCAEFGFETVREYTTVIFSRLNPKPSKEKIEVVDSKTEGQVRELLADFYRDYTMFCFENLFGKRKYYVIRDENGSIVASAQANPDQWRIQTLPGVSGKVLLNLFTHLPVLRKLINKHYRFVTIEGIYCKPGFEDKLNLLLEHLLSQYQVNSAIMVVDAGTDLYQHLRNLDLGMVDKLNKEVRGHVICRFFNFTTAEKTIFNSKPAYISGIDVT